MNILDQLQADAITVKKVSSTKGGEYASPCPWCGGTDRFIIWPGQGRYFCRMCGKKGDFIQYLIEFDALHVETSQNHGYWKSRKEIYQEFAYLLGHAVVIIRSKP